MDDVIDTTDTRCQTRTGRIRCPEQATHLVVRPAVPGAFFPTPEILTLQCEQHTAMWTRRDRRGVPVHPGMVAERL